VDDGPDEGHREDFHRGSFEGRALGDDRFVAQALLKAEENGQVNKESPFVRPDRTQ
jgi:hypothetical protein